MLAAQRLAGGAHGIELVGLRAVATGRSCRTIDLDDPLTLLEQERGEPRAVTAGALDRPDPTSRSMLPGEGEHALRAEGIGGDRHVGDEAAGRRHDRGGVRVLVGVDPDDSVDLVCEHRHGCPPAWMGGQDRRRAGLDHRAGRTVMGHTLNRVDRLLIRPTPRRPRPAPTASGQAYLSPGHARLVARRPMTLWGHARWRPPGGQ